MFNFMRGNVYERADGRRLIKAWMCALGVLVSTALGAGDDVAVWTPMASSQRPYTDVDVDVDVDAADDNLVSLS